MLSGYELPAFKQVEIRFYESGAIEINREYDRLFEIFWRYVEPDWSRRWIVSDYRTGDRHEFDDRERATTWALLQVVKDHPQVPVDLEDLTP